MRNSHVAVLSALGVILLGVVVVVAALRFALSGFAGGPSDAAAARASSGESATSTPALRDFDAIVLRESWAVEVSRGDDWRVELVYPEERADDIEVTVSGGRLVLDREDDGGRRRLWGGDSSFEARITMPALAGLEIEGAGSIEFRGFSGERLEISIAGAGHVEGHDGRYALLDLAIGGAANVDLNDVPVRDANVELSGASNVELTMDGGELSGSLSGFGNLSYSGSVSNESVAVSGFGRVGRD